MHGTGKGLRSKTEMQKRSTSLISKELFDKNLLRGSNNKVLPVAANPMNVCNLSKVKLKELD